MIPAHTANSNKTDSVLGLTQPQLVEYFYQMLDYVSSNIPAHKQTQNFLMEYFRSYRTFPAGKRGGPIKEI